MSKDFFTFMFCRFRHYTLGVTKSPRLPREYPPKKIKNVNTTTTCKRWTRENIVVTSIDSHDTFWLWRRHFELYTSSYSRISLTLMTRHCTHPTQPPGETYVCLAARTSRFGYCCFSINYNLFVNRYYCLNKTQSWEYPQQTDTKLSPR